MLGGMPVVCCSLHSQVAPVCAALAGLRVVYVQLEGGALPVALSDTVRELRACGLVEAVATVGACFGGDIECVSVWSALAWAKASGAEAAVCAIGPGIVGTGTRLGHGGTAAATAANAALALGGRPVLAARVSEADPRERHRGVSRCSTSCWATSWSAMTARAGRRPPPACRSRTWVAAPTTTPRSSRRRSRRDGSRANCSARPELRPTDAHIRPRCYARRAWSTPA